MEYYTECTKSSELKWTALYEMLPNLFDMEIRDGPFDIQGGLGFFLATSFFFSVFAQQVIFFKSKLQQVFYFFEKTH